MKNEIKYIKLADSLFPTISSINRKIDEENFFVIKIDELLKIKNNKFHESTLRLVLFAYDIIVTKSDNVFILRRRNIAKDKTPLYWKKAVRKLRRLIKDRKQIS